MHPVFLLMKSDLLDSLTDFLKSGERKIDLWFNNHKLAVANFSDKPDIFTNINTPDELSRIAENLKKMH
jgi:molybdopterin-guanine dinucleotide biosynthesis protein A